MILVNLVQISGNPLAFLDKWSPKCTGCFLVFCRSAREFEKTPDALSQIGSTCEQQIFPLSNSGTSGYMAFRCFLSFRGITLSVGPMRPLIKEQISFERRGGVEFSSNGPSRITLSSIQEHPAFAGPVEDTSLPHFVSEPFRKKSPIVLSIVAGQLFFLARVYC